MGSVIKATFDYALVDKDTKGKLVCLAADFGKMMTQHADFGFKAGKVIADAHDLLAKAGKEGEFSGWVETQLKVSRQTAYNYMWAFERFGNCKTVLQFDASAMYALAAPSVPEAAVKEAIKLTEKGQHVDKAKAKEIVDKLRQIQKPKPPKATPPKSEPATEPPPVEPNECAPGKHKWDGEGICSKCYVSKAVAEPVAAGKIAGGTAFPVEQIEASSAADEAAKPKTPQAVMEAVQGEYDQCLEYLKQARRVFNILQGAERSGPWLIETRTRVVQNFESLRDTLVAIRPGGLCTKCKGKGCEFCHNTGHLTGTYLRSRK